LTLLPGLIEAVSNGHWVAIVGPVLSGKTTLLWRLQDELRAAGHVRVVRSLAVEKEKVDLATLQRALFYGLTSNSDYRIPRPPDRRLLQLLVLIRQRPEPVALCIDEAHDIPETTFRDLRRLRQLLTEAGARFAVVLAGQLSLKPKLRWCRGRRGESHVIELKRLYTATGEPWPQQGS
jgi:type II secretory pathway predicted ATPase ExeA